MSFPPLLGRDPDAPPRTRRFIDHAGALLNQLMLDGTLAQNGVQSWGIVGLFYTGHGAPASTLGYANDYYLDLDSGTLYKNV